MRKNRNGIIQKTSDEKARLLDDILSYTSQGIIATNADNVVIFINAPAQQMLETASQSAIGCPLSKVLPGSRIPDLLPSGEIPGKQHKHTISRLNSDDSTLRYIEIRSSVSRDEANNACGRIIELIDRSPLVEAERVRSLFLSSVAQELRAPVAILMNYLSLLDKSPQKTAAMSDIQNDMKSVGNRFKEIANNLTLVAALADPAAGLDTEIVDVPALVRERAWDFHDEMSARHISFVLNVASERIIRVNRRFLGVAIGALLSNAVKFNRDEGTVEVSIGVTPHEDPQLLSITVSDQGLGINDAIRSILSTEVSDDEDPPHARTQESLGIGLYLVRGIVKRMGGSIAVDAKAGSGTTFSLEIPYSKMH